MNFTSLRAGFNTLCPIVPLQQQGCHEILLIFICIRDLPFGGD